jgi:hypothetical protein
MALGWLDVIEYAGTRLARDDSTGLSFGWIDVIELVRLRAG